MNPLTALPPALRNTFYWLYAVCGVVLGAFQVAQQNEIFGLDLIKTMAVFAYVGTALAITAGSNVPSYQDVVEGEAEPPNLPERGAIDTATAVLVCIVVLLVLLILGVIR